MRNSQFQTLGRKSFVLSQQLISYFNLEKISSQTHSPTKEVKKKKTTVNNTNRTKLTPTPSMCPIVLLLLVLLTAGASAIEKNIAHPAPTETSIVSDAVLDKIIASPLSSPSSYPEDGKVQEMMQEYTTLMTDFDAASHNHVEHTSKILDVAERTDVFAKKHRQEKEELTKVVKAKREEARIKIHTFAMEVYATMEEEIQEEKDRLESEEARLTAQTTLLQDHVKTWDTTQETLNKYEGKKPTLAKRMLVTLLEKDKQAKKTVFNAADESPTEAPVSAPGNQRTLSSRRLKLESQQVFDCSGASDININVRKTVKQIRKTHFWWKISHKRKIPLFSKIRFSFPSYS